MEGYEMDIIDYLLKPIAFDRFFKASQKAKEFYDLKARFGEYETQTYLFVRTDKRIEKVEFQEILYVESLGNYVTVHTTTKRIVAYLTLKSLVSQL